MRFDETTLPGVWIVELDRLSDDRGWFARTFDREEFRERGMNPEVVQCNTSYNTRRNTIRGMHYQAHPHGESKLVRCIAGAVYDVAVDLRPQSPTYGRWCAAELTAENRRALYIPAGLAHGFQTLADHSEVLYLMGNAYVSEAARGVRFDDPAFAIQWPAASGPPIVSERDRSYPDHQP
jgi:dTDP-4-dehydrorhamnose 3,5-epimerase